MIKCDLKRKNNVNARFAIVSDVHITHIKEGYEPFKKTISLLSEVDADGFIFAGDIAYMHEKAGGGTVDKLYPKAYDLVNEVINEYIKNVPKFYAIGNHEYPQHNCEEQISSDSIKLFEEKTGHKFCEHNVICGYHIITVGALTYECVFDEKIEQWAKGEIDKALIDSNNKPVFVVFHKPPHNTVVNSLPAAECMSDEFREYLNSNQRIINIVGDLHTAAQNPKNIWQDGFTVIHCPLNAVGDVYHDRLCTQRSTPTHDKYSQAIIMDVSDGVVTLYRIDTLEDVVIGTPWVIDVNDKENWKYTDARFDVNIIPYFKDSVQIKAEYNNGILCAKVEDAICDNNDIEAYVESYDIKMFDSDDNLILSERMPSEYYLTNRSGYFTYTKEISLNGEYKIEITPVSSYYKEGDSVICIITV